MNKLLHYALDGGKRNTAVLLLALLFSVALLLDGAEAVPAFGGKHPALLIPYVILFLTLPAILYTIRNDQPEFAKYIAFAAFMATGIAVELLLYWISGTMAGGSFAEMVFVLFSPLFMSRNYYYTVVLGIIAKYTLTGLIFNSPQLWYQLLVVAGLSVLAYVVLRRLEHYSRAADENRLGQYEHMLKGIVAYVEVKDPFKQGHSERVAEYTVALAKTMGIYSPSELDSIYNCCLMHDIGMAHMPDHILSKPGRLTKEEYDIVKRHPVMGAEALKHFEGQFADMELLRDIVLYHHERWDGQGYPEGLGGEEIPLAARITALADAFDSITTRRAYRDSLSADEAYKRIMRGSGSRFDPTLVAFFEKAFSRWKEILNNNASA